MEPGAVAKKSFQASVASRVSRQSRYYKVVNGIIPGDVQKSPGIYHTAEEDLGKPQLADLR